MKNSYRSLHEPIKEQNELDGKIQEQEEGKSGLCFDSLKKLTIEIFRYHDIGASRFSFLLNHVVCQKLS